MFENRVPSNATATVANGATTATPTIAAAGAGLKNRVWLDFVALGAAGQVVVKDGTTQILATLFFPCKDTKYVGILLETSANTAMNFAVTLDAAAGAAGVVCDVSYRSDTRA